MMLANAKIRMAQFLFAGVLSASTPCLGGTVSMTSADAGVVKLEADQATFDEIVEKLAGTYGFGVERSENADSGEQLITTKIEGKLDAVLRRLLRNRNYLIVRKKDDPSQIEKIVLLAKGVGAPAPKTPEEKSKKPAVNANPDGA